MPKGINGFQKGHETSHETRRKIGDALRKSVSFNCDYCGIEKSSPPSHYAKKRRHFCSTDCYARFREELLSPEEQHAWKGGITKETQRGRGSKAYKTWQKSVFIRDNYTCVWCGATSNLEADHIFRWSTHKELRYEVSNGRTLCMTCHNKTRNKKYYENKELLV